MFRCHLVVRKGTARSATIRSIQSSVLLNADAQAHVWREVSRNGHVQLSGRERSEHRSLSSGLLDRMLCPIALRIRRTRSDSDERCLIGRVPRFRCRTELHLCK